MERIAYRDVEGLRVGRFGSQINTTCILYRLGSTVVDTGPPNQWRRVREFLAERAVERVVVTHHHEDHAGNLGAIRRGLRRPPDRGDSTGAGAAGANPEIYSPAQGIAPLAAGFPLQPYRRVIWGRPLRIVAAALPERIPLPDGRWLQPIAAPGHSPDMTCYLEPERGWLFSGDLYIASRPRYLRADEELAGYLASLRKALALDFEVLFCSHRGVIERGKEALRRKLDYLESLCERARELRRQGRSPREIARRLLGREDLMSWITGLHFSKRNLIEQCLLARPADE